jgi:uncharacterized protein YecE (DUF72 family)
MILIGTSGYNYPEWKGNFYPSDLPAARMLPYYAARFPTVEINYTFYRIPTERIVSGWAGATPEGFKLTLKAPRRMTHDKKLRDSGDLLQYFCATAGTLGSRLGALLFQLPPTFRKDVPTLTTFLDGLPPRCPAAFEFRHESWHDDAVFDALRARNAALCIADSEKMSTPVVTTADFGYYRLRDEGYTESDLKRWAEMIGRQAETARDVFVYFKHEEEGKGPELARRLMQELGLATGSS